MAYIVGARPNFVKAAPVIDEMRRRLPAAQHVLVHTGQHYDREMAGVFVEELGLTAPDYVLDVGSGTHAAQTARALERTEGVLAHERPDAVVVVGDVNSTLAGALAAAQLNVPVAHVEAGLRSYDRTMPEELNRVLVDQIAEWCFTHSPEAESNLLREGIAPHRIYYVGNTMIDTLVRLRPRIDESEVLERFGLERGTYILVTLHRPALVDGPLFDRAIDALARLAEAAPVVYPMHPRSRARLSSSSPVPPRLRLTDPMGYIDFLALQAGALAVITDSGGVQEETTFLGVPCFTLRSTTERPITVTNGTNRVLGLEPELITSVPRLLDAATPPRVPPPLWDGRAAPRIVDVLAEALQAGPYDPFGTRTAP